MTKSPLHDSTQNTSHPMPAARRGSWRLWTGIGLAVLSLGLMTANGAAASASPASTVGAASLADPHAGPAMESSEVRAKALGFDNYQGPKVDDLGQFRKPVPCSSPQAGVSNSKCTFLNSW